MLHALASLPRAAVGAALLCAALAAHAALGLPESSIAADGSAPALQLQQLQAQQSGSASPVSAQRVVSPTGVQLTEYVSQGVVFAVSWNGAVMPDLPQLLAGAFPALHDWLAAHPLLLNQPIAMDTPQLVVRAEGHMRAFRGFAYLPALVPAGYDINQIGN